jgi:type IV secretory pathway TrbL component
VKTTFFCLLLVVLVLTVLGLNSCAGFVEGTPVTTSFFYRDRSGAKAGLSVTGIPKAPEIKVTK